jgi:uncharacterized protein involved in exopolysaccharide biosynthesis
MKLETVSRVGSQEPKDSVPLSQQGNMLDILIVLSERRRFILLFTLAMVILVGVVAFLIPNKYTAEAVVLPPTQSSSVGSALLSQVSDSGALASLAGTGLGIKNSGEMYVSLFRSRTIEDGLIQRFNLMARYRKKTMVDTREAFEKHAAAVLGAKDGLIRISVTDRDPNFAAQLANAYVAEFRKHSNDLTLSEASQRRAFFEKQLQEANANLTTAEEAMKTTEQSTGVLQLDSQARALIESAAVLRGQVAAKEVQLQSMRSAVTEDNPQYIMVEQQLDALRVQLAKVAGPNAAETGDIGITKTNIPEAGMAYLTTLRNLRYYETVDELLAKQFEMAKLEEAREGVIQVSDIAIPPDKKSSPNRALIIVVGAIFAFIVACGWCVFDSGLSRFKQNQQFERLRAVFK